ncbi:hypothetical protein COCON_G00136080 [Conger conger]|uniref:Uncharacterized protein n=1 Tax=Conger conger TaxID=82655 RepID=A0A9Q1HXM5_CONCO|nr:hypothetical protein COCON_G00136080 [Conger conger]
MASEEETSGGARKATKSKLFEFLVHGVSQNRLLSDSAGVPVQREPFRSCLRDQPVPCVRTERVTDSSGNAAPPPVSPATVTHSSRSS